MHPSTVEFVSHQSETATRPPERDKLPRQSKYIEVEIPRTFCQIFILSFFFSLNAAACPDEMADDKLDKTEKFRCCFDSIPVKFLNSRLVYGGRISFATTSLWISRFVFRIPASLRSAIIKVERYKNGILV